MNFSLEIALEFVFSIPPMIKVTKFLILFDSKLPLFHPTYNSKILFQSDYNPAEEFIMSKTFYSKRTDCLTVPKCHFLYNFHPLVYGILPRLPSHLSPFQWSKFYLFAKTYSDTTSSMNSPLNPVGLWIYIGFVPSILLIDTFNIMSCTGFIS